MAMPLLKGIVNEKTPQQNIEVMPITLADLTAEEIELLQAAAQDAQEQGLLDGGEEGAETAADEAAESDEQQAMEAEEGTEQHSVEEWAGDARACADEAEDLLEQIKEALDEVDDGDVASEVIEKAEAAFDAVEQAAKEAESFDETKVGYAAAAAQQAQESKEALVQLLQNVQELKGEVESLEARKEQLANENPLTIWARLTNGGLA